MKGLLARDIMIRKLSLLIDAMHQKYYFARQLLDSIILALQNL